MSNDNKKNELTVAYIVSLPTTGMATGFLLGKSLADSLGGLIGLVIGYVVSVIFRHHLYGQKNKIRYCIYH